MPFFMIVPEADRYRWLGRKTDADGLALARVRHAPVAGPEQWLLIAWLADDAEPLKYYLSTLPAEAPPNDLVALAQRRWRVFHHHAALTIAAYGLLVSKHLNVSGTSKKLPLPPDPCGPARQSGGSSVTSPTHWPRCVTNSAHDCSGG